MEHAKYACLMSLYLEAESVLMHLQDSIIAKHNSIMTNDGNFYIVRNIPSR